MENQENVIDVFFFFLPFLMIGSPPWKLCPSDQSSLATLLFQFMCISLVYLGRLIRHTHTCECYKRCIREGEGEGGRKPEQLWPQFHCQAAGLVNVKQQDGSPYEAH